MPMDDTFTVHRTSDSDASPAVVIYIVAFGPSACKAKIFIITLPVLSIDQFFGTASLTLAATYSSRKKLCLRLANNYIRLSDNNYVVLAVMPAGNGENNVPASMF